MALTSLVSLHLQRWRTPWLALDRLLVPAGMAFAMAIIHVVEVGAYAVLYSLTDASNSFGSAMYFSVASYSTASVEEAVLRPRWRLVGAMESLNGMLLIGWSTAFLFQNLQRLLHTADGHPLPVGAIAKPSPRPRRSGKGAPKGVNSKDTELIQ